MPHRFFLLRPAWCIALLAALLFVACGMVGGATLGADVAIIRHFVGWRSGHTGGTGALVAFTQLGGALVLLPVTVATLAFAAFRKPTVLLPLAVAMVGGRFAIEAMKVAVARPRPSFDAHPVAVFSQSFPSAHAGNSMIVLLSLALWLSPPRWQAASVAVAIALALAIGATRPMLGVHWPSDVVGGWSFGLAWVLGWWLVSTRDRTGQPA
jgi:undecaprenyl-diphosphatase